MNNDELKETVECRKMSYEELEHENDVLVEKNVQLQKTIDVLLRALVQSDYERNCNLEYADHYIKLYLQESKLVNELSNKNDLEVLNCFKKYFDFELVFENNQTYLIFKSKERYLPIDNKLSISNKYYEPLKRWLEK